MINRKEALHSGLILYTVTTEINENWWRRLLRKVGINKKGNIKLQLPNIFKKGDVLEAGAGFKVIILK